MGGLNQRRPGTRNVPTMSTSMLCDVKDWDGGDQHTGDTSNEPNKRGKDGRSTHADSQRIGPKMAGQ